MSVCDNFEPSNVLQVSPAALQVLTSEFRHSSTAFSFRTATNSRLPIICASLVSQIFMFPPTYSHKWTLPATLVTDFFDVLQTVHLSIILAINQLNAQILVL